MEIDAAQWACISERIRKAVKILDDASEEMSYEAKTADVAASLVSAAIDQLNAAIAITEGKNVA